MGLIASPPPVLPKDPAERARALKVMRSIDRRTNYDLPGGSFRSPGMIMIFGICFAIWSAVAMGW